MTDTISSPASSLTDRLRDRELLRTQALVDGQWVEAESGQRFAVHDPGTGVELATVPRMGRADTARAIERADESATAALAEQVAGAFGGIDVLVNNAGIFSTLTPGPLEDIPVAEWRRVMEVNVLGCYLVTRAVVGAMRTRGGGRIVNIASGTPFKGVAHLLHYVTSKGAVIAMTRSVARELGEDNILVNAVAPGFTLSDGVLANQGENTDMRDSAPSERVLRRDQQPADIVGAVRFLSGPMSSFITGQTVVVDGGAYFH
ncbi:MAG TPA: SDR family oxidoreductase [Pseudonocardiaceae bacterium]|jgi:NAD(P)-dependent dehydrogenase (short-subunit alcohol dehydrogenase family)|nr:SDR family oxidoreductase [Pseudonocardiaceae bacterium]